MKTISLTCIVWLTLDGDWFNGISCVCGFSVYDNFEVDTIDVHHSVYENYNGVGVFQPDRSRILTLWCKSVIKYRPMVKMLEMCPTGFAKVWCCSCFKSLSCHYILGLCQYITC